MQKRTNPLELKVDAKDYTPAPAAPKKEASAAETQQPIPAPMTEVVHTPKEAAPAVPSMPEQEAPVIPEQVPAMAEDTTKAAEAVQEPVAQPAAKEPIAAPAQQEQVSADEAPVRQKKKEATPPPVAEDHVAPVRPGRPAPPRPVRPHSAEDRVRHGENIADNDVSVAVRFRVAGDRIDRKMVLARVSKDVCKLAQALYPEQSLGSIIEGALLTRAFLQDRDAFDEAAREIIKKGGKIKC